MKKIYLALLLLSTIPAFGQNQLIGLKGGVSFTNVFSEDFLSENDFRNGFMTGLTYEHKLKNKFSIELEISYFQKGFRNDIIFTDVNGSPTGEKHTSVFNYDYLSLPIKGGYSIGNKISGFINLGIVPSFLVNARAEIPAIGTLPEEKVNITDRVTSFDFGGLAEIGLSYKLQEQFLIFTSVSYQQSFLSITNDDYFKESKAMHYGMTIAIGVKYALKK
jgi:hypothetical protein